MAVSSLDELGVAPEDMTPAEAKELARLMEQVRALEEGTSTTRRETPALFTAEEKPQRTRKLQRPKSARARYPSKTLARSAKDFAKSPVCRNWKTENPISTSDVRISPFSPFSFSLSISRKPPLHSGTL